MYLELLGEGEKNVSRLTSKEEEEGEKMYYLCRELSGEGGGLC